MRFSLARMLCSIALFAASAAVLAFAARSTAQFGECVLYYFLPFYGGLAGAAGGVLFGKPIRGAIVTGTSLLIYVFIGLSITFWTSSSGSGWDFGPGQALRHMLGISP